MKLISTRDLSLLPEVHTLKKLLQSMAVLDALLCPEWQYRYYSFDANWSDHASLGSMRNGQGDDFFALFNSHGCFLKGFVHDAPGAESPIDYGKYYSGLAEEFHDCLQEPALETTVVSFCIWRNIRDSKWKQAPLALLPGHDPDGSLSLLSILDGNPETYRQWAESYYEREVSSDSVKIIYQHHKLTDELIRTLNTDLCLSDIQEEVQSIGYPL